MVRLGLDQFSSVTINADTGKVAVAIAKKDLRVPLVQANIKAELENAHQQAAQLSL
jgi:hypothetical protein